MASIFYDGNLHSGISLALKASKSVACFIKDEGEESSRWENEYFGDAQVQAALTAKAITLRIRAGSKEAAFLSAYYPVSTSPALILIYNGQLTLELNSGQDGAAFKTRILTTLVAIPSQSTVTSRIPHEASVSELSSAVDPMTLSSAHDQPTGTTQRQPHESSPISKPPQPDNTDAEAAYAAGDAAGVATQEPSTSNSTSSSSRQSSAVENLLQERRRRLEVHKQEQDATEKAERKAKADARKASVTTAPDSAKAKQASYAQQQQKRREEAKLERTRVLRQIEQDKAERREKEERRKAIARVDVEEGTVSAVRGMEHEDSHTIQRLSNTKGMAAITKSDKPKPLEIKDCAVQVRLFDGSTIRNKFKTNQTLTEIRDWVDRERSDDVPFNFKQILSPMPNRSLTISEEKDDLRQLDLVPSATLVMVPVRGYTAAYADAGPSVLSRGVTAGYNAIATGAGVVSGALGSFLGFGQAMTHPNEPVAENTAPVGMEPPLGSVDSGINIRTLRDQHERSKEDGNQLYNGNQINVQPRNDPEDIDK